MKSRAIALLFGGRSGEHEVSVRSAVSVANGLAERHRVLPVLVDKRGRWLLQEGPAPRPEGGTPVFLTPSPDERGRLRRLDGSGVVAEPDVYFPVLHGTYGEDGTVQGLLELAGVPYVGAGVAASAAAMDKELMKALFAHAGLPQVAYRVLRGREPAAEAECLASLGLPLFVKPANLGSSVAVSKVKRVEELGPALDLALAYDIKVLTEAAATKPREVEVSVLGNEAPTVSVAGEIVPDREFYDYASKYSSDSRTELRIPAPLSEAAARAVGSLAVRAFQAVDAAGYARVDFFVESGTDRVLLNEINTIPGFTSISMFPKLWEATGLGYAELLARLVDLGLARHDRRSRVTTDYRP
jgi:D-alanine-D-alanine ligase